MVRLIAIKNHSYWGRQIVVGQKYDCRDAEAKIFLAAGLSKRDVGKVEPPKPAPIIKPQVTKPAPAPIIKPIGLAETRDQSPNEPEEIVIEESSPADQVDPRLDAEPGLSIPRTRKKKYNTNEMVPKK